MCIRDRVISVTVSDGELKECRVVVPNDQLSLAIGNRGQNAKLAAKLTGYKIDIKPEFEIPIKGLDRYDSSRQDDDMVLTDDSAEQ